MDERVTVVVSAESVRGALVLTVHPVGGFVRFGDVHGDFTVVIWTEDPETVRMSLRHRESGTITYLQGGATLRTFAQDVGLVGAP